MPKRLTKSRHHGREDMPKAIHVGSLIMPAFASQDAKMVPKKTILKQAS